MTVRGIVYESDTIWVDVGAYVVLVAGDDCEGIELGDMIYDGPKLIGFRSPPIEREHKYPRLLPGYRLEQCKRSGQRVTDHLFETPFGLRWLFMIVKEEPDADIPR